jgi:hypothetical protein
MSLGTPKSGGNRFEGGSTVAQKIMAKFGYKVKQFTLIVVNKILNGTYYFRKDKALVVRNKEFHLRFKWKKPASEVGALYTSLRVEALYLEARRLLLHPTSLLLLRRLHL